MQTLYRTTFFTMPDSSSGFLHDLGKAHFVLQRWKLPTQTRKKLNENALYALVERLAVAIEQPYRSQVLHDPSRVRREGGGGISDSFL
jgi:hypothetical protein